MELLKELGYYTLLVSFFNSYNHLQPFIAFTEKSLFRIEVRF